MMRLFARKRRDNHPIFCSVFAMIMAVATIERSDAQGMAMPPPAGTNPPSLQNNSTANAPNAFAGNAPVTTASPPAQRPAQTSRQPATNLSAGGSLPQGNGQVLRKYDLSPYTGYLSKHDRPQQAVVDWVLRETGSDVWFSEPFGFLSADRSTLSVYHTPEMHEVVGSIVDRFIAGDKDPQVVHLRMMTVGSPNWRNRAHTLMQHVGVDSPGLQAWLLTKENAAMVLQTLKTRTDTREVQAVDVQTHNGQTEKLVNARGRNYVQNLKPAPTGWPPYEPQTGEIQEGYKIELSPLLSVDRKTVDCVIRAEVDQVDKLVPVDLDLPLPSGEKYRARIEVPQVVSWRLNERFRWPTNMVLLLSCGVVASPERSTSSIPLLNIDSLTGTTAGRADALLFIEFRGRATENVPSGVTQQATMTNGPTRGRY